MTMFCNAILSDPKPKYAAVLFWSTEHSKKGVCNDPRPKLRAPTFFFCTQFIDAAGTAILAPSLPFSATRKILHTVNYCVCMSKFKVLMLKHGDI